MATFAHRRAPKGRPGRYLAGLGDQRTGRLAAASVVIAALWPLYVFQGSQLAFAGTLAVACAAAADLAWGRAQLVVPFLVALLALLGPEASGGLAAGHPVFGGVRLIDAALIAALASLLAGGAVRSRRSASARAVLGQAVRWLRRPTPLVVAFVVGWAVAVWLVRGPSIDTFVRSDLRLGLVVLAFFCLAWSCRSRPAVELATALAGLAVLLFAKALAIYATDFWTIGSSDRLQASFLTTVAHPRVILVGGDTLLVLAPGLAILALTRTKRPLLRAALTLCALCGVGGVLLSGTRTSVIVTLATVGFAALLTCLESRRARPSPAVVVAVALVGLVFVGGAAATDVSERLATSDAPHVGLNFRKDEAKTIFRLPTNQLVLGQGIGGSFVGKDVNGKPVRTGWAHVFPLWVLLKAGVVGAAAVLFLLAMAARAGWSGLRAGGSRARDASIALVLLFGVLGISMTLGRAALPEGAAFVGLATALLAPLGEREP